MDGLEDAVLTSWLGFVRQRPVTHLSLHYDGIRINKKLPCAMSEFCARCSDHIAKETGFLVNIREKEHHYLFNPQEQERLQLAVGRCA